MARSCLSMVLRALPAPVAQGAEAFGQRAQAFGQSAQAFGRATDAHRVAVEAAAAYRAVGRRFAAGSGGLIVGGVGLGAALAVGTLLLDAEVDERIEDSGTYS